jgi:hypothetical protein
MLQIKSTFKADSDVITAIIEKAGADTKLFKVSDIIVERNDNNEFSLIVELEPNNAYNTVDEDCKYKMSMIFIERE